MVFAKDRPKLILPQTEKVNLQFSVKRRLKHFSENTDLLAPEREALETQLDQLDLTREDPEKWLDIQRAELIGRKLRLLDIQSIKPPLELDYKDLQRIPDLRRFLVSQFRDLSVPEKLAWFDTFSSFIVTPDVTNVYKKIQGLIDDFQPLGQQFNFLLGGQSGMGKTSLLLLLMICNPAIRLTERTIIPVKMAEAPHYETAKRAFPRSLLQAAGGFYNSDEREDDLYNRAVALYLQSRTILLLVDEA